LVLTPPPPRLMIVHIETILSVFIFFFVALCVSFPFTFQRRFKHFILPPLLWTDKAFLGLTRFFFSPPFCPLSFFSNVWWSRKGPPGPRFSRNSRAFVGFLVSVSPYNACAHLTIVGTSGTVYVSCSPTKLRFAAIRLQTEHIFKPPTTHFAPFLLRVHLLEGSLVPPKYVFFSFVLSLFFPPPLLELIFGSLVGRLRS